MKSFNYKPRIVDSQIKNALSTFGAVCVEGPKWCGKTWTSDFHAKSKIELGDPSGNFQNRQLAELDPKLVLEAIRQDSLTNGKKFHRYGTQCVTKSKEPVKVLSRAAMPGIFYYIKVMLIYHASKQIVESPEIRKTKFTKDFSWGFYCTNDFRQAVRWANRGEGTPYVNHYEFTDSGSLKVLKFEKMTDEWLDFIAACRNGGTHQYDVVEGPMADDTVWNFVNDFLTGRINRKQFWALAEFKYPTHQISFHTLSALACLKFLKYEVKHDGSR